MRAEPLSLSIKDAEAPVRFPGVRARSFVFSSRGDRVPGRLWLPTDASTALPVVLLAHGGGGSKDAAYMDAAAGPWVAGGIAVASIDFPLHGERAEAKLRQLLLDELASGGGGLGLAEEFGRQATSDLGRALDALAELPQIDSGRFGFAGFSLGAIVGAHYCGGDSRLRAAALALAGASLGPPKLDAEAGLAAFAPHPVLLLNMNDDETVPRKAAEALFAAAGEPKQQLWFEGSHTELPGRALKAMYAFFAEHLDVGPVRTRS